MKFGIFQIPFARKYGNGQRTAKQVIDWDLTCTKWADEYGLDEAFFAEHYTLGYEPSPAPDAMIAAASQVTSQIRLGAAAHLLPYHNPIALAHRMMWLDHMTGGRYIAGVAPGAYPHDAQLFGTGKNNNAMMAEALDIIDAIWTRPGPFTIKGEFWTVDMPAYDSGIHGPHAKPLQLPHPPMLMTGMQPRSPTLTMAGTRGYQPMSQQVHENVLVEHWDTYATAAHAAGRTANRKDWRILRDIVVADTDQEARDLVMNGETGGVWAEHIVPMFKSFGMGPLLTGGLIDMEDLTMDWMLDNILIVGSPETVAGKIRALYEAVDGFGTIVSCTHDHSDDPDVYRHSFELLGTVVKPMLADLVPELAVDRASTVAAV